MRTDYSLVRNGAQPSDEQGHWCCRTGSGYQEDGGTETTWDDSAGEVNQQWGANSVGVLDKEKTKAAKAAWKHVMSHSSNGRNGETVIEELEQGTKGSKLFVSPQAALSELDTD